MFFYVTNIKLPAEFRINGVGSFLDFAIAGEDLFFHYICFVGSPHEAKNFSYTFEYKNEEMTPPAHCLDTGQMISIDGLERMKDDFDCDCFAMPQKLFFKKFVRENRTFEYSVKIRNMKEEAKDENVESGVSDNDD